MNNRNVYQVTAGNIGSVYLGNSGLSARTVFREYVKQSVSNYGRAAGESVTLWRDGEPIKEHVGHCPHV